MAPFSTIEAIQDDSFQPITDPWCENDESFSRVALSRGPLSPKPKRLIVRESRLPRKRVSFAPKVEVHLVPHMQELSEEDRKATWWTSNDYELIKRMYRATVKLMMNGQVFANDDKDFCSRGLESKTRSGSLRRFRHKEHVRKAFLKAQLFQHQEGFSDPLYLAEIYAEYTRSSGDEAYCQGLADQYDANS